MINSNFLIRTLLIFSFPVALVYAFPSNLRDNSISWFESQLTAFSNEKSAGTLANYKLVTHHPIPSIIENLSGITFDSDLNQFWAVTNNPSELFSLSLRGEVLKRFLLHGFEDTEDLVYLGNGKLVIIEERRMSISILDIPLSGGSINKQGTHNLGIMLDDKEPSENKGLEGVSYDSEADRLLLVQEKSPRRLYSLYGLNRFLYKGELKIRVERNHPWIESKSISGDLSSLSYDLVTGNITFLNEESSQLSEFDESGNLLGKLFLKAGHAGLNDDIPQAEGVTFDNKGNLYIVSEPNLFYVFAKS